MTRIPTLPARPLPRRVWLRHAATAAAVIGAWPLPICAANGTPALAPTQGADPHWRATSRLNYGTALAGIQHLATEPIALNWALGQIDAAHLATQRPASIPQHLGSLNLGIPELIRGMREQRQAQRAVASGAPAAAPPTPSVPPAQQPGATPPQAMPAADLPFIQRVVRQGQAWHLMAASNPALEQPLLARMIEFWFNHFNVYVGKGSLRTLVGHYLLHAIRPHALGRFEDLLLATARHPAMLLYLDQAQSVADGTAQGRRGLNENYARELMELHTLGADGGYTQADVRALARILTGWTVDADSPSGFRFVPRLHDRGSKTFMGLAFGATGESEGIDAIRYLARHPSTARRVARRLAQWFIADEPPPTVVDRIAASFTQSGGDIREVLRTLVQLPEFWDPSSTLFKTPLDFACSALTALGGVADREAGERDVQQALGFLAACGQPLHAWQTPDGYKVDKVTWLNPEALTRRADLALALAARRNLSDLPALRPHLSAQTLARIDAQPERLRAGLMLASPDFMRK